MEQKTIIAPEGANYLKDWMTEIPANCILSKGVTGCGATTLAIEQAGHTIIAMPFVGLIDNKVAQYPDTVLGIYGRGDKTTEIREYIEAHDTIKIATTFDSLRKVCETLEGLGVNPYKDAHLIVDEWHILFNSYDYRNEGIRRLLTTAPKFDKVTYISATPIERKYYFEEIKHLPEYRIEWPNAKTVNIRSHCVNKPREYMAGICRNKIANKDNKVNYHIFINSVDDIASIIRTAKLTPDNTRVICSQSEETLQKNLGKLPDGFTISKALDELKSISFYTSTCFEGQDIIDNDGRTFIVSNAGKEHTLMDISTSFIQICGRIRKSKFKNEIIHFYSTTRYNGISLSEFEESTYKALQEAQTFADYMNNAPESHRERIIKQVGYINEPYARLVGDRIEIDVNMANFDIINFKIVNNIYKSQTNVINEMTASGLNITDSEQYTAPESIELIARPSMPFWDLFDRYCTIRESQPEYSLTPDYWQEYIENMNPLVKEAYEKLGKDEVRRMKYHQSNIKREIIKLSNKGNDYKIASLVGEMIEPRKAIPVAYAKLTLQEIYDHLGLNKVAKATDLTTWFETQWPTKRIQGKSTACVTLIRSKFIGLNEPEVEF